MTLKINNMLHVWHVVCGMLFVAPASVEIRTNGMATLQQHQRRNEDDNNKEDNENIREGGQVIESI